MILQKNKSKYRLIDVKTDISTLDSETLNLIEKHSYYDYVENDSNVYVVIKDFDDTMKGIITNADAILAESFNFGYFRYTKQNEKIFVFTKTYPANYLNCAIYDFIRNKELFQPTITYHDLVQMSKLEKTPEFKYIYKDQQTSNVYLVSDKEIYSDIVGFSSGKQIGNYFKLYSEPRVLYKYVIRQ